MRVCHCHGITDREIRACVKSGARSAEAVGRACGAGSSCGGCKPLVEHLVARESGESASSGGLELGGIFSLGSPVALGA